MQSNGDDELTRLLAEERSANEIYDNSANDELVDSSLREEAEDEALNVIDNVKQQYVGSKELPREKIKELHEGKVMQAGKPKERVEVYGGEKPKGGGALDSLKKKIEQMDKEIATLGYVFDITSQTSVELAENLKSLDDKFDIMMETMEELDKSAFDDEEDELKDFKLIDVDIDEITRRVREQLIKEFSAKSEKNEGKKKSVGTFSVGMKKSLMYASFILLIGGFIYLLDRREIISLDKMFAEVKASQETSQAEVKQEVRVEMLKKGAIVQCGNDKIRLSSDIQVKILGKKEGKDYFVLEKEKLECKILQF